MAYYGSWKIDDFLTFFCNTHTATTGAATDADAEPTYRIYEDETGTPIANGTLTLIDSTNTAGFYSERVQLTAAIGYEKGKCYTIYISATVSSVVGTTHHNFQVEAEVDANTVSAANVSANVAQWLGTAVSAGTAGTPNVDVTRIANAAVATGTAQLGVNVVNFGGAAGTFSAGRPEVNTTHAAGTAWGSGAITAASIATDAIGAAELAADAATEIANAVWALDATGQQTQGTFGQAIGDPTTQTSILARLPNATAGAAGGLFIAGTNAATAVTTSFTTTFTGNLTGSVASVTGAVGSVTGLTNATIADAVWDEAIGDHAGVGSTGEALSDAGGAGTPPTAAEVADAVWDEAIAGHLGAGSTGEALNDAGAAGTPPTAAEVADAVWDEDATAHQTAGTFGKAIGDPLVRTNSLMQSIPDAAAGAAGGLFIAGTNAATTITTGLTTTFTGNLTGSVGSVTGLTASNLDATISSRLAPTVAGRTLDVTTTGGAGVDWGNVENPTTVVGLSGTTVKTATDVETDTANIQSRLPAALVSGKMDSDVGNIQAAAIDLVLDEVVEGTTTMRQALRLFLSALASKVSGAGTTTITFRDIGDTKNRIVATVDADGNRSALTLNVA